MDCAIYPTLDDAKAVASGDPSAPQWKTAMKHRLSVGVAYDFDEQAAPLQFKQVVVGGVLSDMCRGWDRACLDRAPDLVPLSITPFQRPNKAR